MELINNLKRGYKDLMKWVVTPEGKKALKLGAVLALSVALAYGVGYLMGHNSNPAPIIIQTNS